MSLADVRSGNIVRSNFTDKTTRLKIFIPMWPIVA